MYIKKVFFQRSIMKRIKTFYPNASHFPSQIVHCVSGKVVRERAQKIKNSWEKNTHTINLLPLSVSQYSYFVPPPLVSSLCIQNTSQGVPKNHIGTISRQNTYLMNCELAIFSIVNDFLTSIHLQHLETSLLKFLWNSYFIHLNPYT